jgi:hypothetical protein
VTFVPVTAPATVLVSGISMSDIVRGSGSRGALLQNGFSSDQWGNAPTYNTLVSLSDVIAGNKYFEFSLTVDTGYTLSLASMDTRLRSSTPANIPNYQWQYSFDGFATNGVASEGNTFAFGRAANTSNVVSDPNIPGGGPILRGTIVPEPATVSLILAGLTLTVVFLRRRRG